MITRWVKTGTRGVQVSRACGFHVGATLGNGSSTSELSDHFHRYLRRDRSTTSSTARGTAAGLSSLVPGVNKGNCGDQSSGCLGPVRRASSGPQRWNSNVERASSRTQLTRFLVAEYPPTLSSMRARGPATASPHGSSMALRKLSTTSEEGSKTQEGPDGEKKVDIAAVAGAGIGEPMDGLPEEPRHSHVEMPSITDVSSMRRSHLPLTMYHSHDLDLVLVVYDRLALQEHNSTTAVLSTLCTLLAVCLSYSSSMVLNNGSSSITGIP